MKIPPGVRRWLYLAGPVSLSLGWWLCMRTPGAHKAPIAISRADAIERATTWAAGAGADGPWALMAVQVEEDASSLRVAANRIGGGLAPSPLLPVCRLVVTLSERPRSSGDAYTVTFDPRGNVIGFRIPVAGKEVSAVAQARSFAAQYGLPLPKAPETVSEDRTYTFPDPLIDGLAHKLRVTPRRMVLEPDLPAALAKSNSTNQARLKSLTDLAKLILVAAVIYALRLFVQRRREREIPGARALLLILLMTAVGAAYYVVDSDRLVGQLGSFGFSQVPPLVLIGLAGAGIYAAGGFLLGGAYAATEGDLREGYPGKLLALDALLSGRWLTRPVGLAFTDAAVLASFGFLLAAAGWYFSGEWLGSIASYWLPRLFSRSPELSHMTGIPRDSVWAVVAGLLVPLAFLQRNPRMRRLAWVILPITIFLVHLGLTDNLVLTTASVVYSAVWAACLLAGFEFSGVATSLIAITLFQFFVEATSIMVLRGGMLHYWIVPVIAAAFVPFAWAAWRGAEVTDDEVRPHYARLVAERYALRAKVEAAREAQSRMMPAEVPTIPGMSLAVSCHPAGTVGGDFYDVFPLSDGRHAIFVASGAGPGLPATLTIALAKGFFRCTLPHSLHPGPPMEDFLSEFAHILPARGTGAGVALIFVDPITRVVEAAKAGPFPLMWVRSPDGSIEPAAFSCDLGVVHARFTLGHRDLLFVHTRGLTESLEDHTSEGHQRWFARAARDLGVHGPEAWHLAVLDHLWGKKRKGPPASLPADLTLLTLTAAPELPGV